MFDQGQFLQLFRDIPDMNCVLDVGHALVTGMDIPTVQRELGSRICAYHLHNNDGKRDTHARLRDGIMDWASFAQNAARYTPDATGVLEYMTEMDMAIFRDDAAYLEQLLSSK